MEKWPEKRGSLSWGGGTITVQWHLGVYETENLSLNCKKDHNQCLSLNIHDVGSLPSVH
jgi:hypothetical protein